MLKLSYVADYLIHQLRAKNRHGIHSPFVYRLIDEVIYDFEPRKAYSKVESLRQILLKDNRVVSINGQHTTIKKLAKNTLVSSKKARLIWRLVNYFSPNQIIEIGTSLGLLTSYLAIKIYRANVISIGSCWETSKLVSENLQILNTKKVQVLHGLLEQVLLGLNTNLLSLDFVLINKGYDRESIFEWLKWCLPKLNDNAIVVIDGIDRNKEIWRRVQMCQHITVTIDLFGIGLVFVRPKQAKENFKIKF